MEFQFDLVSFVLGGLAAILSLHAAKLVGYAAARIYYGLTNADPSGWICAGSTSSSLAPAQISTKTIAKARGQRFSGS